MAWPGLNSIRALESMKLDQALVVLISCTYMDGTNLYRTWYSWDSYLLIPTKPTRADIDYG